MNVQVFASLEEAAEACAWRVEQVLGDRLRATGRATLAVSGGSTPKLMFEALRGAAIEWGRIHWFWVDERCVGPEDAASNYRLTRAALFDAAGVPPGNVHRVQGELRPGAAAAVYEGEIREFFGLRAGELPVFDLIHLGFGPEGHTASLFPGSPLLENRSGIAAAVKTPKPPPDRVTLLPGVIAAARTLVVLGGGADKAEVVKRVIEEGADVASAPVAMANRDGAEWFLDEAAYPGRSAA